MKTLIDFTQINNEVPNETIVNQVVNKLREDGYIVVSDYEKFGDCSEICELLGYEGEIINQRLIDSYRISFDGNEEVRIYENFYDENDDKVVLSVDII